MNLIVLRTLVAIAEHGSFAEAARVLHLSQSAISTHIQALEAELGAALFDRSKRPPVLTDAGTATVAGAKDLLARYDIFRSGLSRAGDVQGRLRLGAVGSTLTGLLPSALTTIRARHPGLHIEVVSGFSDELLHQVERRRLDAAIISDYDSSLRDIHWRPFLRERIVMVTPQSARETDARRLMLTYPYIRYSPSAAVGRLIDEAIKDAKLEIRETMRLDWLEAIEAMVHHGLGISIVPERRFPARSDLRVRTLPFGNVPFYRTLGLVEPLDGPKRRLTDTVFSEFRALAVV